MWNTGSIIVAMGTWSHEIVETHFNIRPMIMVIKVIKVSYKLILTIPVPVSTKFHYLSKLLAVLCICQVKFI